MFALVAAACDGRDGVGGLGIADSATLCYLTEASQVGVLSGGIAAVPRAALTAAPRQRSGESGAETTTEAMS